MNLVLHVVDAFTDRPFTGNPAAVCVLPSPRDAAWMQLVAREMNLSETCFLEPLADGAFALRWFTPKIEVPLCGHATLASAHVLWMNALAAPEAPIRFITASGLLTCRLGAGGWIEMDFPAIAAEPLDALDAVAAALGARPVATFHAGEKWLAEFSDAASVRALRPDFARVAAFPAQGVIATAPGDTPEFDFVSRYFAPAAGIDEDPVTGSAHCVLAPFWQEKLGRADFIAHQCSTRGGVVRAAVRGDRVLLGGQAVSISRVELLVD